MILASAAPWKPLFCQWFLLKQCACAQDCRHENEDLPQKTRNWGIFDLPHRTLISISKPAPYYLKVAKRVKFVPESKNGTWDAFCHSGMVITPHYITNIEFLLIIPHCIFRASRRMDDTLNFWFLKLLQSHPLLLVTLVKFIPFPLSHLCTTQFLILSVPPFIKILLIYHLRVRKIKICSSTVLYWFANYWSSPKWEW